MSRPFPMSYTNDDRPHPYCPQCGRPEHGSAACNTLYSIQQWEPFVPYWPWPKGTRFRMIDDQLFIVDPGSPPIYRP